MDSAKLGETNNLFDLGGGEKDGGTTENAAEFPIMDAADEAAIAVAADRGRRD